MLFLSHHFRSRPRSCDDDEPLHGRIAFCLIDFDGSGTTFDQSMPMVRPKPRHAWQAPIGDWYEKRPRRGASNERAHFGQVRPRASGTRVTAAPFGTTSAASPEPRRHASSIAAPSLRASVAETFSRSTITSSPSPPASASLGLTSSRSFQFPDLQRMAAGSPCEERLAGVEEGLGPLHQQLVRDERGGASALAARAAAAVGSVRSASTPQVGQAGTASRAKRAQR